MAVRLEVTVTGLRVQFSGLDFVAAGRRRIFLPYTRILGARVMTRVDAVASSPRLPSPGLWWSGRYRAGCWGIGERRQLWSVRQATHVVVVYLAGRPFHRVVVDVDQPEREHRRIDAALLHSKKTTPRRSIRRHRRSATDRLDDAPPRVGEHGPPRPSPNRDREPAHAVPVRPAATDHQLRRAAPEASPQERTASVLATSAAARTPSGGFVAHLDGPVHDDRAPGRSAAELTAPSRIDPSRIDPSRIDPSRIDPSRIDPSVAARLRLYEYREGERARHSGDPEACPTCRRPDARH